MIIMKKNIIKIIAIFMLYKFQLSIINYNDILVDNQIEIVSTID